MDIKKKETNSKRRLEMAGFTPGPRGPTAAQRKRQRQFRCFLGRPTIRVVPNSTPRTKLKKLDVLDSEFDASQLDGRKRWVFNWAGSCTDGGYRRRSSVTMPSHCYNAVMLPVPERIIALFGGESKQNFTHITMIDGSRYKLKLKNKEWTWTLSKSLFRDFAIVNCNSVDI